QCSLGSLFTAIRERTRSAAAAAISEQVRRVSERAFSCRCGIRHAASVRGRVCLNDLTYGTVTGGMQGKVHAKDAAKRVIRPRVPACNGCPCDVLTSAWACSLLLLLLQLETHFEIELLQLDDALFRIAAERGERLLRVMDHFLLGGRWPH